MKKSTERAVERRSYGQHCAVARTLDVVGDRWTLLIVRELLLADRCRFGELRAGLPGVASNLLTDRLRALQADGIVEVVTDGGTNRYRLTPRGAALTPVVRELTRWGLPLMVGDDRRGDAWRGRWAALALDALLADVDTTACPPLRALLTTDDDEVFLIVEPGQPVKVTTGDNDIRPQDLTVRVTGTVDQLQRLLGGDPSGVTIDGDPAPLLTLLAAAGPI